MSIPTTLRGGIFLPLSERFARQDEKLFFASRDYRPQHGRDDTSVVDTQSITAHTELSASGTGYSGQVLIGRTLINMLLLEYYG